MFDSLLHSCARQYTKRHAENLHSDGLLLGSCHVVSLVLDPFVGQ